MHLRVSFDLLHPMPFCLAWVDYRVSVITSQRISVIYFNLFSPQGKTLMPKDANLQDCGGACAACRRKKARAGRAGGWVSLLKQVALQGFSVLMNLNGAEKCGLPVIEPPLIAILKHGRLNLHNKALQQIV